MKETINDIEKIKSKLGIRDNDKKLIDIFTEEFEEKQNIKTIENTKWRLANEKLTKCKKIARMQKEKDQLFINMGLKFVEPLEKEKEND
jgi:hypothetical protein